MSVLGMSGVPARVHGPSRSPGHFKARYGHLVPQIFLLNARLGSCLPSWCVKQLRVPVSDCRPRERFVHRAVSEAGHGTTPWDGAFPGSCGTGDRVLETGLPSQGIQTPFAPPAAARLLLHSSRGSEAAES